MDIFGDKANVCVAPDVFVIFGAAPGSDQRQDRTAIRWRDRHPTVKFEAAIGNYAKSELIYIEFQASVVIAYEDGRVEDTQIRLLFAPAERGGVRELWRFPAAGLTFRVQVDFLSDRELPQFASCRIISQRGGK